jgi:predicted TIM-barrel fold metal-dependent hydrolase
MFNDIPVIAIEEHYWDRELFSRVSGQEGIRGESLLKRLYDLGELRIAEMDEAGVDMQVLSLGAPGAQKLDAKIAETIARGANNRLAEAVGKHPERLQAFACIPTELPQEAARELERAVTQLGFKGAMIHGMTNGMFHDEERFWCIYEMAEKLDVPVYFHPSFPNKAVSELYYDKYAPDFPQVVRAAWGYTVETATQAIRLILSRVFEKHPGFKVILGHFGETLPYQLWRIDQALRRPGAKPMDFRGTFCRNFWITTSGHFSTPALVASMMEMGMDHIIFAIDYPFVANKPAMDWLATLQISHGDMEKMLSGNAKKLLRL